MVRKTAIAASSVIVCQRFWCHVFWNKRKSIKAVCFVAGFYVMFTVDVCYLERDIASECFRESEYDIYLYDYTYNECK